MSQTPDTASTLLGSPNTILNRGLVLLLVLVSLLSSCGGGGGGTPNPQPNYPAAVEELSDDDLLGADVPALPQSASALRSSSLFGDCDGDASIDASDALAVHNLTSTSSGFVTAVPEDTTSKVIAWAMFELPAEPGARIREISASLDFPPELRLFYAVGNFTRGRWEYGGRIANNESNSYQRFLSPGQRYNLDSGPGFLLLMVGHPGDGDMSGYQIRLEDILISSYKVSCLAEGFESQTPGSVNWGEDSLESWQEGLLPQVARLRQDFAWAPPEPDGILIALLLPVIMRPENEPELFFFQSISGDWNGDGRDTVGFYDPKEVNGPRHSYNITVDTGGGNDQLEVNVAPLVATPGRPEPNGIIAILIGLLRQPVPGATVTLKDGTSNTLMTAVTDARGQVVLPGVSDLEPGSYQLSFSSGLDSLDYDLTLMEEEGIFYFKLEQ
ncbi:carboxypeptidase regulatory-like domain-containing protein [bacterium]|nr:carboxypeptidase regulatory-like domain-containing protein [bacterium]